MIDRVAAWIRAVEQLVVLTGAGISAQQPVVEVAASTESGEAPHEQGATTEEYLEIFEGGATQRVGMDRRSNAGATFTTGCQSGVPVFRGASGLWRHFRPWDVRGGVPGRGIAAAGAAAPGWRPRPAGRDHRRADAASAARSMCRCVARPGRSCRPSSARSPAPRGVRGQRGERGR